MSHLLSVQPIRAQVDNKFQIVVRNVLLKQEMTLHFLHHSGDKEYWEGFGHVVPTLSGTYLGSSGTRLSCNTFKGRRRRLMRCTVRAGASLPYLYYLAEVHKMDGFLASVEPPQMALEPTSSSALLWPSCGSYG